MRNEALDRMLSAYLDGELTQQETQRVRVYLENCEEAREDFREMEKVRQITSELSFAAPPDARLDELAQALSVRAPRRVGWVLVIGTALTIILGLVFKLAAAPDVPLGVKLVYGAFGGGFLLLLGSVARQRWLEAPYDRYRGVKR